MAPCRCSAVEKEDVKERSKSNGAIRPECEPEAEYPFESDEQKGGFFPTRDPGNFPSVGEFWGVGGTWEGCLGMCVHVKMLFWIENAW